MTEIYTLIGAGILFIFSLVGSFFVGKSKGKSAQEVENKKQEIERNEKTNNERVRAVNETIRIKDDANRLEPGGAADKLRQQWSRDGRD